MSGGHFVKQDPAVFDAPFFSISPAEAAASKYFSLPALSKMCILWQGVTESSLGPFINYLGALIVGISAD